MKQRFIRLCHQSCCVSGSHESVPAPEIFRQTSGVPGTCANRTVLHLYIGASRRTYRSRGVSAPLLARFDPIETQKVRVRETPAAKRGRAAWLASAAAAVLPIQSDWLREN